MIRICTEKLIFELNFLKTIEEIAFSFIISLIVENRCVREQNI
jgi:hypothetical protein